MAFGTISLFLLLNPITILVVIIILSSLKIVKEYEQGVKFTLGKFKGTLSPGLRMIFPIIQSWERVDMRIRTIDVPDQDCITKDNISVRVNAVLYFKVMSADKAIIKIQNYYYAVSQLAQTTMRDIVGEITLDELLSNRDQISAKIKNIVDKASDPWGIKVESVDLKHIELPDNMKRTMAKAAESEREGKAVIIKASAEAEAAKNMAKAAHILSDTPGALHLRTLQSLNDISSDQSNTIVFALPVEILRAFDSISKKR